MNRVLKSKNVSCLTAIFFLIAAVVLVASAPVMAEEQSLEYYKMLSLLEYKGFGQFNSQVETMVTVKKQDLMDGKFAKYLISADNVDLTAGQNPQGMSFVLDRQTKNISGLGGDMKFIENVNNQCVPAISQVTKANVGTTWKQSFDLSPLSASLGEINFTLTAINLTTEAFGDMIAVRAISQPFLIQAVAADGEPGDVKCKIGTVYLFSPEIDDIYMSISVFEATTKINGKKEKLRSEVATYKTDAAGVAVDLTGIGKKFEKLIKKIGLRKKAMKIKDQADLPRWAAVECLQAVKAANICAALSCEGAVNPVGMVFGPTSGLLGAQGTGFGIGGSIAGGTVGGALAGGVGGVGGGIAGGATIGGVGLGTAGVIGGATAGGIAVAGGGGGSSSSSSSAITP